LRLKLGHYLKELKKVQNAKAKGICIPIDKVTSNSTTLIRTTHAEPISKHALQMMTKKFNNLVDDKIRKHLDHHRLYDERISALEQRVLRNIREYAAQSAYSVRTNERRPALMDRVRRKDSLTPPNYDELTDMIGMADQDNEDDERGYNRPPMLLDRVMRKKIRRPHWQDRLSDRDLESNNDFASVLNYDDLQEESSNKKEETKAPNKAAKDPSSIAVL
jgi:hypothetical protein